MSSKININVSHSILIRKSCERVWDFTQDFSLRTSWDPAILECRMVSTTPDRTAAIRAKGGLSATLEYKLFDRPNKTSLRMTSIKSPLVVDGGGSWTYEATGQFHPLDAIEYHHPEKFLGSRIFETLYCCKPEKEYRPLHEKSKNYFRTPQLKP